MLKREDGQNVLCIVFARTETLVRVHESLKTLGVFGVILGVVLNWAKLVCTIPNFGLPKIPQTPIYTPKLPYAISD